jgi:hypothetical protein
MRKKPVMRRFLWLSVVLFSFQGAIAQSNRFPAPLGLDRALTGVVAKAKPTHGKPAKMSKPARYVLAVDDKTYRLDDHETELKKFLGKKVKITGNAVGEDVTVNSVTLASE